MKILMIGPGRDVKGGISSVVNQLYAAGLDKKTELKYIATMEEGDRLKKLAVAIKAYIMFCLYIKEFDVVHVHMASRASFYRKSFFIKKAYHCGKKIVIHMHGGMFDVFYDKECNKTKQNKIKYIFSLAEKVIVLSEEWKDKISVFCNPEKVFVLYNAVKIPDFERENYSDRNILFLGRLGKMKGTYDLLEAIPDVLSSFPEAHFYLGGAGEIEKTKKIIVDKHLESSVTCLGWINGGKKEEILKKCNIFVLPSYVEGMPMAVLEAMSYGCIVITTPVGGLPSVIRDNENGYLIPPGDIYSLSSVIKKALVSNSKEKIGKNARNTVFDNFNIDKNVLNLLTIYAECNSASSRNGVKHEHCIVVRRIR